MKGKENQRRRQSPQDAVLEYTQWLRENGYDGTTAQPTIKAYFKILRPKKENHDQPKHTLHSTPRSGS